MQVKPEKRFQDGEKSKKRNPVKSVKLYVIKQ